MGSGKTKSAYYCIALPHPASLAEPDRSGGGTVWTTDVERFVLTPTGTGVGDKWVLSVCGARTSIALSQRPRPRGH